MVPEVPGVMTVAVASVLSTACVSVPIGVAMQVGRSGRSDRCPSGPGLWPGPNGVPGTAVCRHDGPNPAEAPPATPPRRRVGIAADSP